MSIFQDPVPSFNTQPPEGGWGDRRIVEAAFNVSTHSRPKAAGKALRQLWQILRVSTHSRPKAAGSARRGRRRD